MIYVYCVNFALFYETETTSLYTFENVLMPQTEVQKTFQLKYHKKTLSTHKATLLLDVFLQFHFRYKYLSFVLPMQCENATIKLIYGFSFLFKGLFSILNLEFLIAYPWKRLYMHIFATAKSKTI